MIRKLIAHRPSPAMVVSLVALFVSLGGVGAYAANEWNGSNIQNESLTGLDVLGRPATATTAAVDGSLTGADLRDNSIKAADVLESSLAKVPAADTLDGKDSQAFARLGGEINGDGSVVQGSGFTVSHPNTGEYQVSFPNGTLSSAHCPPIVTATVFSSVLRNPQLSGAGCNGQGGGSFTLQTLDSNGVAQDTPFMFIAM
jgi:hypothetical protein